MTVALYIIAAILWAAGLMFAGTIGFAAAKNEKTTGAISVTLAVLFSAMAFAIVAML